MLDMLTSHHDNSLTKLGHKPQCITHNSEVQPIDDSAQLFQCFHSPHATIGSTIPYYTPYFMAREKHQYVFHGPWSGSPRGAPEKPRHGPNGFGHFLSEYCIQNLRLWDGCLAWSAEFSELLICWMAKTTIKMWQSTLLYDFVSRNLRYPLIVFVIFV